MRDEYHRQLNELASHDALVDMLWFDGGGVDWLECSGVSFASTPTATYAYLPGDFGVSTYHERTIYLHILHSTGATLSPGSSKQNIELLEPHRRKLQLQTNR